MLLTPHSSGGVAQRILFIYTKQYPQLGYKQGMHEILAPIIYVVDHERHFRSNLDQKVRIVVLSELPDLRLQEISSASREER